MASNNTDKNKETVIQNDLIVIIGLIITLGSIAWCIYLPFLIANNMKYTFPWWLSLISVLGGLFIGYFLAKLLLGIIENAGVFEWLNNLKPEITHSFTAYCNSTDEIGEALMKKLEKKVLKKNLGIIWLKDSEKADVYIEISRIKSGNMLLGYISTGLLGKSVLKVIGHIVVSSGEKISFDFESKVGGGTLLSTSENNLIITSQIIASKISEKIFNLHKLAQIKLQPTQSR